jgi:hypothetical protein
MKERFGRQNDTNRGKRSSIRGILDSYRVDYGILGPMMDVKGKGGDLAHVEVQRRVAVEKGMSSTCRSCWPFSQTTLLR